MDRADYRSPSTLLALPSEIRHQIYTHVLAHQTIVPSPSLTPTRALPLREHPYTHPALPLLATSRPIHAEALPILISTATLALRRREHHDLLSNLPGTIPSHRRPSFAELRRIVIAWPLLNAYPAEVLQASFPALRELTVCAIDVHVAHVRLLQLWAQRRAFEGRASENAAALGLVQGLMCEMSEDGCDRLLGVLGAAKGRWKVVLGWRIGCGSCKWGEAAEGLACSGPFSNGEKKGVLTVDVAVAP